MRHAPRKGVGPPASLTDTNGKASAERAAAKTYYAGTNTKAYKFKAYKAADVISSLRKIFLGKCAYCESPMEAVGPTEIEHYRPKAGITGVPTSRGYWWLASDWENLLPSCIDCNRARRKQIVGPGMTIEQARLAARTVSGKANHFPIRGAARAMNEADDLALEDALLIDPTLRDPCKHIAWQMVSDVSVVAAVQAGGMPDPYGKETIDLLGLNRIALVEQRTRLALTILTELRLLSRDVEICAQLSGQHLHNHIETITERTQALRARCEPNAPYSECAKSLVEKSLADIVNRLIGILHR